MALLEINTSDKIQTTIDRLENDTFSDWWHGHYGRGVDSNRCMTYEIINSVNIELSQGKTGFIIGYLSVDSQYENKQLVPIKSITAKTKTITRSTAATNISIRQYGQTGVGSKQINLNYNNLTSINHNNHDLNFYATISPSNVTINDVTSYSDSLSIEQYKMLHPNVTYLWTDISKEVASGNIDNLVFGPDNNYGHTFSAGTTDGTNKWTTQYLRFTPVVPNNSSGTNTYSYNDITVNSDYSYTISTVSFPGSVAENNGGCVRGYESDSYVYAREKDELLPGPSFSDFTNCNPHLKTSDDKLQIVSNSSSNHNLVADYKTNYPTKTLSRYFANLPDLKGHCIINFKQWIDPGNTSEYPYGLDCIRKEFNFTSVRDITSMSLQLFSDLNNDKTEFLYGDDIYAVWKINPAGAWIDPSLITTNNISDFCESQNASLFLFDAVFAAPIIIVKLNSHIIGTNTAEIHAGNNSCSLQYTVNPMIYFEKTQGKYLAVIDEDDPATINFASSEYIKFTNFSSESRTICFVGKPIGESANSDPYVVKPIVYDATAMTEVGNVTSPDLTNYLKPVTLEPHKSYYIYCDIYSNSNTDYIDYGESTDYPFYCEIHEGNSNAGTLLGNLSWVISDENMTTPEAYSTTISNSCELSLYEEYRDYSEDPYSGYIPKISSMLYHNKKYKLRLSLENDVKAETMFIGYEITSGSKTVNISRNISTYLFGSEPSNKFIILDYVHTGYPIVPSSNDIISAFRNNGVTVNVGTTVNINIKLYVNNKNAGVLTGNLVL